MHKPDPNVDVEAGVLFHCRYMFRDGPRLVQTVLQQWQQPAVPVSRQAQLAPDAPEVRMHCAYLSISSKVNVGIKD